MAEAQVQSAGFLLELSPDWLILRASENAHSFLGEYHQRLIGEPLAKFTLAQSLHDLRNSLSRQRGASGIARAYRVRLIDEPRYFDIAFQQLEDRILLEGLPTSEQGFGEWLGSVGRLLEGLRSSSRKSMLEDGARRMRALTGFDQVCLMIGDAKIESSRGKLPPLTVSGELPPIVADSSSKPIPLFPRDGADDIEQALLRAPTSRQLNELRSSAIPSTLCVPIMRGAEKIGHFQCCTRAARTPSFEQNAAAELFAQMFGMLLPG